MTKKTLTIWLKKIGIFSAIILALFAVKHLAPDAVAQGLALPSEVTNEISTDIPQETLGVVVVGMVNFFIGFLGIVAVIVFVYAGVLWVVSGGNEEAITKAKKVMTYAAGGLIVVLLSYTIVTFITSSAGGGPVSDLTACKTNADCNSNQLCVVQNLDQQDGSTKQVSLCVDSGSVTVSGGECQSFRECRVGADIGDDDPPNDVCVFDSVDRTNVCKDPSSVDPLDVVVGVSGGDCTTSSDCGANELCLVTRVDDENGGTKQVSKCTGVDSAAVSGGDCKSFQECRVGADIGDDDPPNDVCVFDSVDRTNVCKDPSDVDPLDVVVGVSGGTCQSQSDCSGGQLCVLDGETRENACKDPSDISPLDVVLETSDFTIGGTSGSVIDESVRNADNLVDEINQLLGTIGSDIDGLPTEDRSAILDALGKATIDEMLAALQEAFNNTTDPTALRVIENLLDALERLQNLRTELDELRNTMPESQETVDAWNEASDALDSLIADPDSNIKLRRFQTKYRNLKDLIRKFPVVKSQIRAVPTQGNVPFTVTFDGLNSSDPTGGTISEYKWSFRDNTGNEVSLGASPVLTHEFTEANTYVIRLQASTSNRDDSGFKTAIDGVSTIRIQANPPSSQVLFRINGVEVSDAYHVTLSEAQAGLTFDPSPSVPAFGRVIQAYEWSYGDTITEKRTSPTTVVHAYQKAGEYFVKLKTIDNQGDEDKSVIKLSVKNVAADISIAPSVGDVNTQFVFKGVRSRSDDGVITDFDWEIQTETGETVAFSKDEVFTHTFDSPGKYKAILIVTDITGARDTIVETLDVQSRPPVANFTYDIPKPNHPNRVEFNAITSYDPDQGDSITYSWDFDGDGEFDVVDTSDIQTLYEYKKAGQYRAKLQVQDKFGKRSLIDKIVKVDSILGADISLEKRAVQVGEEVNFRVSDSNAVAYLWEFGDGETGASDELSVTHAYSKKGKYRVKLNFFDAEDNDNFDRSTVIVGNADEPVAAVEVSVNSRLARLQDNLCDGEEGFLVSRSDLIRFSGGQSINTDGSGRLLSYDWKFNDGSRNNKKEFTHKFDEINREGECFSADLIVRDQISGKLSDADKVYFKVLNLSPEITDFVITSAVSGELMTPAKVHLKAVNPRDPDGTIKKYKWYYFREGFEDEPLGTHFTSTGETDMIITAAGLPDVKNRYFFVVEITDSDNQVFSSKERFGEISYLDVINGPNLSPVVDFSMDKTTISAGDSITFVSRSYDPQGDKLPNSAFAWDFDGDGQFDDRTSGAQVSRQFNTPGEYNVRLKVTHRGLSTSANKTVFVEATQSLPQAAFTYKVDGVDVDFDGSLSRYDPDLQDTSLRFEWDFDVENDANGNGIKDDDVESTDIKPSFRYPAIGRYRAKLNIKDSLGQEGVVVRDVDLAQTETDLIKNSFYSLGVSSSDQPITTLDIVATPAQIEKGGSADITATVLNADNSPYEGMVYFEVLNGSGEFTPNPVKASNSKATAIFTALDSGKTTVRVRATATNYGDLSETAIINVR